MGNRIFYILNDFHELPKCANPSCGKTLRVNFRSCSKREDYYSHCCCARCVQLSPRVREKIEETTMARHGCKRGNVKPGTVKKREATMVERHGQKATMQCSQLRAKVFKTNLERYGSVSPFGSEKVQEAIKKKNVENLGVEHPFQPPVVQEKAKRTLLENYGATAPFDSLDIRAKACRTMLERHGSTSYLGTQACLEKTKKHCNEKLGVDFILQAPSVRSKARMTNMRKWGHEVAYGYGTDEFSKLMLNKYGVAHPSQSPEVRKL